PPFFEVRDRSPSWRLDPCADRDRSRASMGRVPIEWAGRVNQLLCQWRNCRWRGTHPADAKCSETPNVWNVNSFRRRNFGARGSGASGAIYARFVCSRTAQRDRARACAFALAKMIQSIRLVGQAMEVCIQNCRHPGLGLPMTVGSVKELALVPA